MTDNEYNELQNELSELIDKYKIKNRFYNDKHFEGYKEAVLACKSVLSNYWEVKGSSKRSKNENL